MAQVVEGISSVLEHLTEQVRELEQRVSALEAQQAKHEAAELRPGDSAAIPAFAEARGAAAAPATWRGFPPAAPNGIVPVIGKSVLGLAGAYLLRAVAESGAVPKLPVIAAAVLYAGFWMVNAVRNNVAHRLASILYAITSALILSPLVWESTVTFKVLPPSVTGAVLVAFVVLAMVLGWTRDLQMIPWIATLASVLTGLALISATHALVPLTIALLAIAATAEIAACCGHELSLRIVPAFGAVASVGLLVYLMTSSERLPEDIEHVSPTVLGLLCFALMAIYGGSVAIRNYAFQLRLTGLEITQSVLAFALGTFGVVKIAQGAVAPWLGLALLLLAAACYWGTLVCFVGDAHTRNRRVSATWAAALLLVASFLLFSSGFRVLFLCVAAIAAAFTYARTAKISLGLHVSLFLASATLISSVPRYLQGALAGDIPRAPAWDLWVVLVSAGLCVFAGGQCARDERGRRLLWLLPAVVVGFACASLGVAAVVSLAVNRVALSHSILSVIRTSVNCVLALVFAGLSARLKRVELGWAAYIAIVFGTLKLLFEDLRVGNAGSLVFSLLFYGLILILLPRVMHRQHSNAAY